MKRVLVTGATGQVGFELKRSLAGLAHVVALDRAQLNLAKPAAIGPALDALQPDLIINPAAYTAVDRAESEPELARAVNAVAPGELARWAAAHGAWMVHYSTDYVFDGTKQGAWTEDDTPNPQSVYGRTKLAGEDAVRAANPRHIILRTSWVYGAHGANFLKTMLRLAAERDALSVVADQVGAPTGAALIADISTRFAARLLGRDAADAAPGTYHLAAAGEASWYDYARHVVAGAAARGATLRLAPDAIRPIATEDYPLPAPRPRNSRLDCHKLEAALGLELRPWQGGVNAVLDQLIGRLK